MSKHNNRFVLTDKFHYNLSRQELCALHALKNDTPIIIKPADKGGAVVIMDRELYAAEAKRQLYNPKYYKRIERPLPSSTMLLIDSILSDMFDLGFITRKQFAYLHPLRHEHFIYCLRCINLEVNGFPLTCPRVGLLYLLAVLKPIIFANFWTIF